MVEKEVGLAARPGSRRVSSRAAPLPSGDIAPFIRLSETIGRGLTFGPFHPIKMARSCDRRGRRLGAN